MLEFLKGCACVYMLMGAGMQADSSHGSIDWKPQGELEAGYETTSGYQFAIAHRSDPSTSDDPQNVAFWVRKRWNFKGE